jgi:hypothetical protein
MTRWRAPQCSADFPPLSNKEASTMNQTPASPDDAKRATIEIAIDIEFTGDLASLAGLVEKVKPLIESAKKIGSVEAIARIGRQKLPIV